MSPDIDIKTLWDRQETAAVPGLQEIVTEGKQLRKQTLRKVIIRNLILMATVVMILLILFNAHPKMINTKIGGVMTVVAVLLYIVASGSILPTLYKSNPGANTNDYLKQLVRIKRRNQFIHSTVYTFYFIFLFTGMFLYLLGYVQQGSWFYKIAVYGVLVLWIGFNWFYTRKKRINKERAEIDQMINKWEGLSRSIKEE